MKIAKEPSESGVISTLLGLPYNLKQRRQGSIPAGTVFNGRSGISETELITLTKRLDNLPHNITGEDLYEIAAERREGTDADR